MVGWLNVVASTVAEAEARYMLNALRVQAPAVGIPPGISPGARMVTQISNGEINNRAIPVARPRMG